MFALIGSLVVFLITLFLLFPESAQELLLSRVPIKTRPDPDQYGMKLVPTVAIFVFGFAMFKGWDQLLHRSSARLIDPVQIRIAELAAVAFSAVGAFGCIFPRQLMKRLVPRFRDDPRKSQMATAAIQLFGVICLLIAVELIRRSLP